MSNELLSELAQEIEDFNQNYIFEAQTFFFLRPAPDCIYLDFNRKGRLYLFSRIVKGEGDKCKIEKFDYDQNLFRVLDQRGSDAEHSNTTISLIANMMKSSLDDLIAL